MKQPRGRGPRIPPPRKPPDGFRPAESSQQKSTMPRSIWKGSISFGLVNIPVSLYPATKREELKFNMLRGSDLSPINFKRVAEADGKEVPWDQIVKGYEYEKGKYVVLKDEDFKRVDIEATQTVDIMDFVKTEDINPMFFNKPYYLEPAKGGANAYALLRDVLNETGKIGIAKVVIKTRQHLAGVKPQGNVLVLELMHFGEELVDSGELNIPAADAKRGKKELEMAKQLVDQMTVTWDPQRYTDDYRSALMALIDQKIESGGRDLPAAKKPPRTSSKVIDLVSVLQKSLEQSGGAAKKPRETGSSPKRRTRKKAA
jgi:DNA end-binding protein Ku